MRPYNVGGGGGFGEAGLDVRWDVGGEKLLGEDLFLLAPEVADVEAVDLAGLAAGDGDDHRTVRLPLLRHVVVVTGVEAALAEREGHTELLVNLIVASKTALYLHRCAGPLSHPQCDDTAGRGADGGIEYGADAVYVVDAQYPTAVDD